MEAHSTLSIRGSGSKQLNNLGASGALSSSLSVLPTSLEETHPKLPDSQQVYVGREIMTRPQAMHASPLPSNSGAVGHIFSSSSGYSTDLHFSSVSPHERHSRSAPFISQSSSNGTSLPLAHSSHSGQLQSTSQTMEAMKKKMRLPDRWFLVFMISLSALISGSAGAASLADQCANELTKVSECLAFATGKAATPTKDCCSAVSEIRESKPVCLCYFIQQAHNGSAEAKSLGIQEAKLLQLPSACKMANATLSDCPKLLNISASSPDYSIFTSNSTSTAPASTSTGTSSGAKDDGSNADMYAPSLAGTMAIAVAIFFSVLSQQGLPPQAGEGFFFG